MKTYLNCLVSTMIEANKSSKSQINGWDNRKRKTRLRYSPRGKYFAAFEERERDAEWRKLLSA